MKTVGTLLTAVLLLGATYAYGGETVVPKTSDDELPYIDPLCEASPACQGQEVIWELIILPSEEVVSFGDLDKDQCEAMKELVEGYADSEPFTALKCRPRWVLREKV